MKTSILTLTDIDLDTFIYFLVIATTKSFIVILLHLYVVIIYLFITCMFYKKEMESTSEKNRSLCDNIRRRGRSGYIKLKEWLKETEQEDLADILELIEDGKDYTNLRETIHLKMIKKVKKGKTRFHVDNV